MVTVPVREALPRCGPLLSLVASIDRGGSLAAILPGATIHPDDHIVLTFDGLTHDETFIAIMRQALQELEDAYNGPVDLEFAIQVDFADNSPAEEGAPAGPPQHSYRLHVLECRPLNERLPAGDDTDRVDYDANRRLFAMPTLLPSGTVEAIDYLVFVDPEVYYHIEREEDRLHIAQTITALNDLLPAGRFGLIGPGRWGSLNSRLSVPISYSDICNARLLVEISPPYTPAPELAYGTDFFQDVLEAGIFVLGIQPTPEGGMMDWKLLRESANHLANYVPEAADWADCVRVIDLQAAAGSPLKIIIDDETNEAIACFDVPE